MLAQRRIILTKSRFSRHIATVAISLLFVNLAAAQAPLSADTIAKIDKIAADTLASTGVPSASVAVVKDGQVVFTKAYGDARLETPVARRRGVRFYSAE